MLRSHCALRIGVSHVHGAWITGRAKGAPEEATARFEGEAGEAGAGLTVAISAVLTQILPRRRLASPYVSVGLAGLHVRAAIMPFAKLPKAPADRTLLVTQRFCREFRLDPAAFAVLDSPLGGAKGGGEAVLCVGVSRALLACIKAALATRGLHADEIAPDYMLRFAETDTREAEAPGMVLMGGADCSTVLVWDAQRAVVHVSSFAVARDDGEARQRMAARLFRYARIVGHDTTPVAVYADGPDWDALFQARGSLGEGMKLLRWPAGQGRWGSALATAKP